MTAHKLSLADEAVITDLLAKNSRLEEEVEYLRNELASMRTGPQSKLLEENRNLRHELAVLVHGVDVESERLREQLVASQVECEEQARLNGMGTEREAALLARLQESQAREAKLREALEFECGGRCNAEYNPCNAREALDLPHDDTALREYRRKVLLEAAELCGLQERAVGMRPARCAGLIRTMAEEE